MPHPSKLAAALVVALVAIGTAQAQQVRGVRGAANATPSANARSAQVAPNPAGLRPLFPAGITSGSGASQSGDGVARTTAPTTTPAATTTTRTSANTSGNPPGTVTRVANADGTSTTTVVNADGTMTSTTTAGTPIVTGTAGTGTGVTTDAGAGYSAAAATSVMGAPAAGLVAGPPQFLPAGTTGYSAVDIARSFISADANRDGELTRSEARRLTIAGMSFEEMDRNFDGVVSRFEYEDGLR